MHNATPLFLADLSSMSEDGVRNHIVVEYSADPQLLDNFRILIAYESVGDYGCDSTSFFLLQNINTKGLFEVHGSHCSCNGFENQWEMTASSLVYLKSDKFYISTGGYDNERDTNVELIKEFIKELE